MLSRTQPKPHQMAFTKSSIFQVSTQAPIPKIHDNTSIYLSKSASLQLKTLKPSNESLALKEIQSSYLKNQTSTTSKKDYDLH